MFPIFQRLNLVETPRNIITLWKHRTADFIELRTVYMICLILYSNVIVNKGNVRDLFGDAIVEGNEVEIPQEILVGVDSYSKQE